MTFFKVVQVGPEKFRSECFLCAPSVRCGSSRFYSFLRLSFYACKDWTVSYERLNQLLKL